MLRSHSHSQSPLLWIMTWVPFNPVSNEYILILSFYFIENLGSYLFVFNSSFQTNTKWKGPVSWAVFRWLLSFSWYTAHQINSLTLSVSHSGNDTNKLGHLDLRNGTRNSRILPGWIDFFFFFSLKLFSSRKQYASLIDNIPHFWESSVGQFFSFPPAQFFVFWTPECNKVTRSKCGGNSWALEIRWCVSE